MPQRNEIPPSERHLRSTLLKELAAQHPLLPGRLYTSVRSCGKPTCRCNRGHKHRSLYLCIRQQGKLKNISIPREMEAEVRQAVENYRRAQDRLQVLATAGLQRLLDEKQSRRRVPTPA